MGNIVAFKHNLNDSLVIHRVVGRKKIFYIIKGDNIFKIDGLIPEEKIFGYVSAVERNGKKVYLGFGPEKFIIALLSRWAPVFLFLNFVWKILRHKPKEF